MIRDDDPARDRAAVRACFAELQDVERGLEPALPEGRAVPLGAAREHEVEVRVGVLAKNEGARRLYIETGFREVYVLLTKPL